MKIRGFTLVELMVVMTIMMVLTAIGVVAFSQVSLKSRDGRRQSDLEKIRTALELYRQDTGGTYPGVDNLESALVPKFIQAIPKDPKTGIDYIYSPDLNGTGLNYTYALLAKMEGIGLTTPTDVEANCSGSFQCNVDANCPGCCGRCVAIPREGYTCVPARIDADCNYEVKNP